MSNNPGASPKRSPKPSGSLPEPAWSLSPASPEKRFLNMVFDGVLIACLVNGIDWQLEYVYVAIRSQSLADASPQEIGLFEMSSGLLCLLAIPAYYLIQESLFQKTIAKLVTGTQVVNAAGGRPSFRQLAARTLVRFIPGEGFTFLGRFAVGAHDSVSGTRVVNSYDLELIPPEDSSRAQVRDPRPPGLRRSRATPR
ncbi:RDD family protein [Lignipirellula cremea]|uniref:RDD family protein n=1 Tax=Lignipirellula cremea TaxID=2528010 RepID=A0A518DXV0_9BACT|nr:RDD family protein [Lignipirellula cremea]QDU96664.1 RDD family protein [Lignipirellula cremea]